jgi:hypothetical protein
MREKSTTWLDEVAVLSRQELIPQQLPCDRQSLDLARIPAAQRGHQN